MCLYLSLSVCLHVSVCVFLCVYVCFVCVYKDLFMWHNAQITMALHIAILIKSHVLDITLKLHLGASGYGYGITPPPPPYYLHTNQK